MKTWLIGAISNAITGLKKNKSSARWDVRGAHSRRIPFTGTTVPVLGGSIKNQLAVWELKRQMRRAHFASVVAVKSAPQDLSSQLDFLQMAFFLQNKKEGAISRSVRLAAALLLRRGGREVQYRGNISHKNSFMLD